MNYHRCYCTMLAMCMYYPAMVNVVQLYRINLLLRAFPCNTAYCTHAGSIFTRPSDSIPALVQYSPVLHGNACNKIYVTPTPETQMLHGRAVLLRRL